MGEAELISVFGRDRVSAHKIGIGEGYVCDGALIRLDNDETLAVAWPDHATKTGVSQVVVRSRSLQTQEALRVGLSLAEVESLNGKPLIIHGIGWDYGGVISSWEGGRLAPIGLTQNGGARVWFDASREQRAQLSGSEYGSVSGDKPLSSEHPILRKLRPTAGQLDIFFGDGRYEEYFDAF